MANYIQKTIDAFGKFHEESHWSQFHNSNIEKYFSACLKGTYSKNFLGTSNNAF